jgi:hypothetical protein
MWCPYLQRSIGPKKTYKELSTLEHEDTMFPRNVGIRLPSDTASYPTKKEHSATPLHKPQNFSYKQLSNLPIKIKAGG